MSVMNWRIISTVYPDQLRAWVIEDGDGIIMDGEVLDEFKAVWIHVRLSCLCELPNLLVLEENLCSELDLT
jgi:hypothetical protein